MCSLMNNRSEIDKTLPVLPPLTKLKGKKEVHNIFIGNIYFVAKYEQKSPETLLELKNTFN